MDTRERKDILKEMYVAGATLQEMTERIGYKSTQPTGKLLQVVLRENPNLDRRVESVVGLDMTNRLEALLEVIWPEAMEGKMGAVDRSLKILEMMAKYKGSAPTSQSAPQFAGEEDSAVDRLASRLAGRVPDPDPESR